MPRFLERWGSVQSAIETFALRCLELKALIVTSLQDQTPAIRGAKLLCVPNLGVGMVCSIPPEHLNESIDASNLASSHPSLNFATTLIRSAARFLDKCQQPIRNLHAKSTRLRLTQNNPPRRRKHDYTQQLLENTLAHIMPVHVLKAHNTLRPTVWKRLCSLWGVGSAAC